MQIRAFSTTLYQASVLLSCIALTLVLSSCPSSQYRYGDQAGAAGQILERIIENGVLHAVTEYSATTYYVYRGEPMGFHYEILKYFTEDLGVTLDLGISDDLDNTFKSLQEGQCDLIAMDLTVTKERSGRIRFIYPHSQTRQVLVQRKKGLVPAGRDVAAEFVRNPLNLAGKVVYVQKGSSYYNRLRNLEEEIGDTIHIIQHPRDNSEELIRKVSAGEIDFTVCDENVALVNQTWYTNLDVATAVSFPQNLAWAVGLGADSLHNVLDKWMAEFVNSTDYRLLYNKYFRSKKILDITEEEFASGAGGTISGFDEYIRKYSELIGWDWRLIASLIYQESRFHPEVKSWSGAFGLMQLMPETANELGIDTMSTPEEQIRAGILYLKYLDGQLQDIIPDNDERIKFILASYNVGIGHVLDARRLAEKYGKDTNIWFRNVDTFLLQKAYPEVYSDPVVYYGYCRGEEPVQFVTEILERYQLYKDVIGE